jgi:hypothetical protein
VAKALCGQSRDALVVTKSKLNAVERSELDRAFWEEQSFMYGAIDQNPAGRKQCCSRGIEGLTSADTRG